MKIKKILLIALIICCCKAVYAENTECNVGVAGDTITVWGKIPYEKSIDVTLRVLNPGMSMDMIDENTDFFKVVNYQEQLQTDNNGNYEFVYDIEGDSGTYNVTVGMRGYETELKNSFYYANAAEREDLISRLNSAKAEVRKLEYNGGEVGESDKAIYDSLSEIINECCSKLDIDKSIADKYIDNGNVYKYLGFFATLDNAKDADDIHGQIVKSVVAVKLNNCTTGDEVGETIETFKSELQIENTSYFNMFCSFKTENMLARKAVSEYFIENKLKAADNFDDIFKNKVIAYGINNAGSWGEIKNIIDEMKELIGISYEGSFSKLKYPEEVFKHMLFGNNQNCADVAAAFKSAAEKEYAAENGNSGGGSGSGGGGKTSGGGGFSQPGKLNEYNNTNDNGVFAAFTDIEDVPWASVSIKELADKGIINGKSKELFAPNDLLTREEFAKLLVEAANLYDANALTEFSDVSKDAWYYKYVASLAGKRLIRGISDSLFGTGNNITREDMAVLAYRICVYKGIAELDLNESKFTDKNNISDYAVSAVNFVKGYEIMSGMGNNMFMPKEYTTRAQAAVVICNMIKLLGE